jgi:hypothetical protein
MRRLSIKWKIALGILSLVTFLAVGMVALYFISPWYIVRLAIALEPSDNKTYWAAEHCSGEMRGSVMRPDGKLEAKVFHFKCATGLFQIDFDDFMAITLQAPGLKSKHAATAMEIQYDWPQINWESNIVWKRNRKIEIAVPESANVWVKDPPLAGVKIDIRRVPDTLGPKRT